MQTPASAYTPEDYLALEEKTEFRHEYRDGVVVPMAGGSLNHNRITGSLYSEFRVRLRGQGLEAFANDVRLWIPRYRQYTYPDVMVIQGDPVYHSNRTDTITNPILIVEVLSKSTQDYDRTTKFKFYRSIPELQEYVLIDQHAIGIEHYTKTATGMWLFQEYESVTATVSFTSINLEMAIADVYEDVDFSLLDVE